MRLYLLCGPAYSGKSTLARALSARGVAHVSLDEILEARGLVPGDGLDAAAWEEASAEACRRVERAAGEVVLDDTLCFRFLRDRYRALAARLQRRPLLVVLHISAEEVLRRHQENRRLRARAAVNEAVLRAHLASFEWPGADESPIAIDARLPLEAQLAALGLG